MNNTDERKPRTLLHVFYKQGENPQRTSRLETPEEVESRIKQRIENEKREENKKNNTTELNCDICHGYICEVYDFDLNGSRFYHKECLNNE